MKLVKPVPYVLPFIFFVLMIVLLQRSLVSHATAVPSPLLNQVAPTFRAPTLFDSRRILSNDNFKGKVTVLNVFASWCSVCESEQAFLLSLSKQPNFVLYGLNYKDDPKTARAWLKEKGNPYALIGVDETGAIAIDWGVYGTPELFVIDKNGIVRYKWIGLLTPAVWNETIDPLINRLNNES